MILSEIVSDPCLAPAVLNKPSKTAHGVDRAYPAVRASGAVDDHLFGHHSMPRARGERKSEIT